MTKRQLRRRPATPNVSLKVHGRPVAGLEATRRKRMGSPSMSALAPGWPERFEGLGKPNGSKYWIESGLREALAYISPASWRGVVNRAIQACVTTGIDISEHFRQMPDGDRKLTRFACYLIAMNADSKKPEVAAAQVYLASLADAVHALYEQAEGVERLLIRDEVTDGQKTLASTAKAHGVENYAFFQNQGYLGMYNMPLGRLKDFKGLAPGKQLMDYMGKTELAANLFRITQTEEKIKNEGLRGQRALESAANNVGRTVRRTMEELSGTTPEHLPLAEPIAAVRSQLKGASKKLGKIDAQ